MCVAGLYFVFLLLEDVIVAYYATDAASQDQDMNIKAAYDTIRKDRAKAQDKYIARQTNGKKELYNIYNASTTYKKWQVERVTQRQYEIINMLWRKTKIFMDEEIVYTTNPSYLKSVTKIMARKPQKNLTKLSTVAASLQTTTPSNIEFYYLDDTQDHNREKVGFKPTRKRNTNFKTGSSKISTTPSFFVFHIKGPYAKLQLDKSNKLLSNDPKLINVLTKISRIPSSPSENKHVATKQNSPTLKKINKLNRRYIPIRDDNLFYDDIIKVKPSLSKKFNNLNSSTISNFNGNDTESTTIYDKIKFFEQYDHNTPISDIKDINKLNEPPMDYNENGETAYTQKILLENVDFGRHDDKQAKHSKKHIIEHFEKVDKVSDQKNHKVTTKSNAHLINVILKKQTNESHVSSFENLTKSIPFNYNRGLTYVYKNASWSDYPFAAVYLYEPSQVHCDAAGINAYWLVASGSCLSRVHKNLNGNGRSAFVAYCGKQWWRAERIAYVKYSLVHPSYHSEDTTRKHLYNIGVIQVVTSMLSACNGWAPISLMSHQFASDTQGSWASAVGWGVDRFDTRYGASDLPRTSLMVYKGLVYIDSCPGNIGYSKAKRLDEGGGVRNVFCMSLPPYSGEENDPVHGGMLLIGGKLIALYLQEERRPWGEQSAQYTGVWRLIPWLMEVAREPDDKDTFIFEV